MNQSPTLFDLDAPTVDTLAKAVVLRDLLRQALEMTTDDLAVVLGANSGFVLLHLRLAIDSMLRRLDRRIETHE